MGDRSFWNKFMRSMELEGEPLPRQPLLELLGNQRVLIENHCGLLEYGDTQMCIKVKNGMIRICGKGLGLALMSRERLIICGCIDTVQLLRGK